jgi:hypothetical protein
MGGFGGVLLLLGIAAGWVWLLVSVLVSRHDAVNQRRSVERFSATMRALGRSAHPQDATAEHRWVVVPGRSVDDAERAVVRRATPVRAPALDRRRAVRLRRRRLAVSSSVLLLLVGLLLTATGVVAPVVLGGAIAGLLLVLVVGLRQSVRADVRDTSRPVAIGTARAPRRVDGSAGDSVRRTAADAVLARPAHARPAHARPADAAGSRVAVRAAHRPAARHAAAHDGVHVAARHEAPVPAQAAAREDVTTVTGRRLAVVTAPPRIVQAGGARVEVLDLTREIEGTRGHGDDVDGVFIDVDRYGIPTPQPRRRAG